jgi:hypothetical protein
MFVSTILVALTASAGACAQRPEPTLEPQARLVAIADLVARPAEYAERDVRVRGRLENAGTNYFRDRRIVLSDAKGQRIDVRPWLPLSRPAPGAQQRTAPTLAEFLDRQVELVGTFVRRKESTRDDEYVFQVTSAKVIDA